MAHDKQASIGQIASMDELALWRSGAPDGQHWFVAMLRRVRSPDQRWNDVPALGAEVVVRPKGVGWDGGDEAVAILLAVGLHSCQPASFAVA